VTLDDALHALTQRGSVPELERAAEVVLAVPLFGVREGARLVERLARLALNERAKVRQVQQRADRVERQAALRDAQTCATCGWRTGERCDRLGVPVGAVGFCKGWRAKER
jgi:hypothetical protein